LEGQAGARGGVTACPSGDRTVPSIVKVQVLYSVWSSGSVLGRYRIYCIPKGAKCQTTPGDKWEAWAHSAVICRNKCTIPPS